MVINSDRPPGEISLKEKEALLKARPFWTWKKAALGAGALALVGVGGAFMLAPEDKKTPPVTEEPEQDLTEKPPPKPD